MKNSKGCWMFSNLERKMIYQAITFFARLIFLTQKSNFNRNAIEQTYPIVALMLYFFTTMMSVCCHVAIIHQNLLNISFIFFVSFFSCSWHILATLMSKLRGSLYMPSLFKWIRFVVDFTQRTVVEKPVRCGLYMLDLISFQLSRKRTNRSFFSFITHFTL